ncbi:2-amino-4-hydroxy-6-hydroxymethyldihydropteridine diphosphokinase [Thiohalocapsa marina]|uniref:2-amino-4-hydroxy-6-hydroxymethyldihydropteridine diphosphokinase n=1 Tax=Thiohalocapsa marina TaxID=424902 RepID=A0A5M8FR36_9GAMM|nr:2-amino-4-hydroxy-6-hydroxymethyldihydropteridine diphosphokinase [Thiohalocapsa marina]KAA6183592.1 2-amino-4-hydroxy-6-hydroxymethyldihydropteridine diphosphokinase [Thiohalocapsa marina]
MQRTQRCWISVGSNQARESSIRAGLQALRAAFGPLTVSPAYETEAVGFRGDPFLNLVVGIDTALPVGQIVERLRAIEDAQGRVRGVDKFAPRTLDLDLLTRGDAVGIIDGYALPRREILDYAFVLGPLAAVAPAERHPLDGRCYAELWRLMQRQTGPLRRARWQFQPA